MPTDFPVALSSCKATVEAVAVIVVFVLMITANVLVTTGGFVHFTNSQIAFTHPVYGLPTGYTFAVWGLIYTLEGIFCIWQALSSSRACVELAAVRLPVIGLFATNAIWLFLFGDEAFWPALVVIALYEYLLFVVYCRLGTNLLSRGKPAVLKLATAAFGANASWVTIATALQIQVNMLEEGWLPSVDFTAGLLLLAVGVACVACLKYADIAYAAVAAWALAGIVANQTNGSGFGCAAQICPVCAKAVQLAGPTICGRENTSPYQGRPNGFAYLNCTSFNATADAADPLCVVPPSAELIGWCYAGIGAVALALLVGLARGALLRTREEKGGDTLRDPLVSQ
jgi:hypothetical protein